MVEKTELFDSQALVNKIEPQRWYCDSCLKSGLILIGEHEDVMTVIDSIETSHKKMSPDCPIGVLGLKIHEVTDA